MANLFLTNKCDRGCSFCFAKEGPWSIEYPARPLDMNEVAEFVELRSAAHPRETGVLGGEPLQYSRIAEVVQLMWNKGLTPKIFTSGSCLMPDDFISMNVAGQLRFVVNVSPWDSYSAERQVHLDRFLSLFGKYATLSYTMVDSDIDPIFLLDYIAKYKLLPFIRLGVALPIIGGGNQYVLSERYRDVGLRTVDFGKKAALRGLTLGTDCGFVACMFKPDELGLLLRLGMDLCFVCRPVMDVGPELEAWHCFPLSKLPRVSLRGNGNLEDAHHSLRKMASNLRERISPGIFSRCRGCLYRGRGQCDGGCLGLIISENTNVSEFPIAISIDGEDAECDA